MKNYYMKYRGVSKAFETLADAVNYVELELGLDIHSAEFYRHDDDGLLIRMTYWGIRNSA